MYVPQRSTSRTTYKVASTNELVALARSRLSRSLTTEECQKYLHLEEYPEGP